ncbi:MAG TPA: phytanoyl-CoA dioxygenase family protein [Planctomycetaceae bacterium]|nr:phytanoyl-CoA dioxygenase family protein [Planctomycetaceae bacterium]
MPQGVQALPDRLTNDEVRFFEENGYLIVRRLLDEQTRQQMLDRTRQDLRNLVEPIEFEAELQYPGAPDSFESEGGKTARRLKAAHERDPVFLEFLRRPPVRNRLAQLLGTPVVMPTAHHNCIMTKQPRFSSDTGWHQDIRYWRFERPDLVTLWLALGAEHSENGCLKVIPGSHSLAYSRERFDDELFLRIDLPENQQLISKSEYVELSPGDVLLFHCRLFHSATRNFSDQPKFSAVFTFRGPDNQPVPDTRSSAMPEISLFSEELEF